MPPEKGGGPDVRWYAKSATGWHDLRCRERPDKMQRRLEASEPSQRMIPEVIYDLPARTAGDHAVRWISVLADPNQNISLMAFAYRRPIRNVGVMQSHSPPGCQ